MRRAILITTLAVLLAALIVAHVHSYYYGVVIDLPFGHWCGYDWGIAPGGFCDVD